MRYLLLAILVISIPCCAARKAQVAPAAAPAETTGALKADSAESQLIAARAHLEMGCPTDATYDVSRQGTEYHVQVKYVAGYDAKRGPLHAPNRGDLVVLDEQGKLIRIDRNHLPGSPAIEPAPEQAVASDAPVGASAG